MNLLADKEKSSSKLGKVFIVIIPLLLLLILAGGIMYLFGFHDSDAFASTVQNIPVLGGLFGSETQTARKRVDVLEQRLEQLADDYEEKEAELDSVMQLLEAAEEEKQKLLDQVDELEHQLEEQLLTDEDRAKQLRELANVYAGMTASKAAGILENLSVQEAALLLQQMKQNEQSAILAKLNPAFAANVTVVMKEFDQLRDLDLAAMQERINLLMEAVENDTSTQLNNQQIVNTFSQMDASQAARILQAMQESENGNEFEVGVYILSQVPDHIRSEVIGAMEAEAAREYLQALTQGS